MITIKEEFLGSVKTRRAVRKAGSDAVVLWLALKTYVASSNSGGFIPEDVIPDLPGVPKRWRRALEALETCGKPTPDGSLGPGLVVRNDAGLELYAYEEHGLPVEVVEERRARDRLRKKLQRDRAKLRTLLIESGVSTSEAERRVREMSHDDVTQCIVTMSADVTVDTSRDCPRDSHSDVRSDTRAPVRTGARARTCPNQTKPNQTKPEENTTAAPSGSSGSGKVPCPPDLWEQMPEETQASLDVEMIPRESQEILCRRFAGGHASDDESEWRTLAQWIRSACTAIRSDYRDPRRRPGKPRFDPSETPDAAVSAAEFE